MTEYLVTVTPATEGEPQSDDAHWQVSLNIEVLEGEPHVVELTVRVPAGSEFRSVELPAIDLERLARAFGTRSQEVAQPAVTAIDRLRRPRRQSGAKPAPPAPGRAVTNVPASATGARSYRRMPDPEVLRRAYAGIGTVAGVAAHFGVPVHTAQGWIGRLRRQGIPVTRDAAVTDR